MERATPTDRATLWAQLTAAPQPPSTDTPFRIRRLPLLGSSARGAHSFHSVLLRFALSSDLKNTEEKRTLKPAREHNIESPVAWDCPTLLMYRHSILEQTLLYALLLTSSSPRSLSSSSSSSKQVLRLAKGRTWTALPRLRASRRTTQVSHRPTTPRNETYPHRALRAKAQPRIAHQNTAVQSPPPALRFLLPHNYPIPRPLTFRQNPAALKGSFRLP